MTLQLSAIAAAIAFGAFVVKSVHLANRSNHYAALAVNQSLDANQIALYAICASTQLQNATSLPLCTHTIAQGPNLLLSMASTLFSVLSEATSRAGPDAGKPHLSGAMPSRPQRGTQKTSLMITNCSNSVPSSFKTSAFLSVVSTPFASSNTTWGKWQYFQSNTC